MPKKIKDDQAQLEISLDKIRDMLWQAIRDKGEKLWVAEVFPSYLIYSNDENATFYRVSWSIMDGTVTLGTEVTEVEKEWVEARAAGAERNEIATHTVQLGEARDPEGSAWDVTIVAPGVAKSGYFDDSGTLVPWHFSEDLLRASEEAFEGVDINLYELPEEGATHIPAGKENVKPFLVKNKVGVLDTVKYVAGRGLTGIVHFLDSAKWLGRNLLDAAKQGKKIYGLSLDAQTRAKVGEVDGARVLDAIKFVAVDSVDIVSRPAAGGAFNRAVASEPAQHKEDPMRDKLIKQLQDIRPDLLEGKDVAKLPDEEILALAQMAMAPPEKKTGDTKDGDGAAQPADNVVTKDEFAIFKADMELRSTLADPELGLPDAAKERIRSTFAGRVFETKDLEGAIGREKDYLASLQTKADDGGIPGSRVHVGIGTIEKAQLAVDKMFGLSKDELTAFAQMERLDGKPFFDDIRCRQDVSDYDAVPRFTSLREMYAFFTGDPEVSGRFNRKALPPELRASADITSATFTYVLGNTLGRRLAKQFNAVDYGEDILISTKKSVKDFRQQEAVVVGGFGKLDTVDPESADYQEIAAVTDEESTYTIGQKGNILSITRKTIINDDISIIIRLINNLGIVARWTHADYVWGKFVDNANCSDGTAWFTSGHGNLGATALSHTTALVAYVALAKMTEKDSSRRLGLLSGGLKPYLVGPVDLLSTLQQIETEDFYYSTNDLTDKVPNPLKGKVTAKVIDLLTDTNDWGMIMPSQLVDIVEMGYLNGRQEPELFVADMPQSEQVFVADKIRHKIRHEYAGAVVQYQSGYKAVVT
jgi:hypothetical protein